MKNFKKGFTLIELLVVIAIIGILSSIVLASLSSARSKGTDAAIATTVSNMRAQAELYYSQWSNYGGNAAAYTSTCPDGTALASTTGGLLGVAGSSGGLLSLSTDLVKKAGAAANTLCTASSTGSGWAVAAKLSSDSTKAACADSTGASKIVTITSMAALGAVNVSPISTGGACN